MCCNVRWQKRRRRKVRWGKNLNFWAGLSVGFLSFVTEQSNCTELSKVYTFYNLLTLATNDQHCLQWRTCQTKSDVSALLLLLNCTVLQRQPPAIEAMLSWLLAYSVLS
jgi:hypothetical protein